jgi:hypothetical protein
MSAMMGRASDTLCSPQALSSARQQQQTLSPTYFYGVPTKLWIHISIWAKVLIFFVMFAQKQTFYLQTSAYTHCMAPPVSAPPPLLTTVSVAMGLVPVKYTWLFWLFFTL